MQYSIGVGIFILVWIFLNVYRKRLYRNRIIAVAESRCSGCGRCVKRCSRRVLAMTGDAAKRRAFVQQPDKCTACGNCLSSCKFKALSRIKRW